MKKFDFSLQKLLDLRQFYEDQAEIELAKAIAEAERIKLELKNIAEAKVQTHIVEQGNFQWSDMRSKDMYLVRLEVRKNECLDELAKAELVVEEKRKLMQEAMKNRKVITKLKDKKYEDYRLENLQEEDSNLDDMTAPRYIAKMKQLKSKN